MTNELKLTPEEWKKQIAAEAANKERDKKLITRQQYLDKLAAEEAARQAQLALSERRSANFILLCEKYPDCGKISPGPNGAMAFYKWDENLNTHYFLDITDENTTSSLGVWYQDRQWSIKHLSRPGNHAVEMALGYGVKK